ncbi:hypothetical protein AQJ11_24630 [Streptomyces corchorusii]|uniref:Uncharacterized protein n=1 Tax=Streptomyces corchorusii TaxID=1903 RepID=A0A101Q3K0_STRCK|nr:hypothetical protein AQJ11_24630 [Streptomyces corchorusii]
MRRYPPIADHGLTADARTCAPVPSGAVPDRLCSARSDPPGLFAAHRTVLPRASGPAAAVPAPDAPGAAAGARG